MQSPADVLFDFEEYVPKMLPELDNVDTDALINPFGVFRGDPKHRTIVCRHWLLGLCQNGEKCGYLHRLDRSKMPACKHGKLCKIKNCPLKHVDDQEVMECIFFKQGFCYNGPNCVRRHFKRSPDEIPKEASFEQCIAAGQTVGASGKKKKSPNENYKVSLCNHWLLKGTCHFNEECHFAHGEEEIQEGYQSDTLNDADIFDPTRYRMDAPLVLPFPETARISYFLFQSPDLRSLVVSKRRGVWSVPVRLAAEINAAIRAYDHVVAYMSVRPLKGIYGIIKIADLVPPPMPHMLPHPMTTEFRIVWLRTVRISMRTVAQLKIGATGMFVGRTVTDSKFESKVGSEIMYIAYRKQEWDWAEEGQLKQAQRTIQHAVPLLPPEILFSSEWIDHVVSQQMGGDRRPQPWPTAPPPPPPLMHREAPLPVPQPHHSGPSHAFLFNASGPVVEEMFGRSMFGLPGHMKDIVIPVGAPLFLLDPLRHVILGVFQAETPLTEQLDPSAFVDWSAPPPRLGPPASVLPLQLRFSLQQEAPPLPAQDPDLLRLVFAERQMVPLGGPLSAKEATALAALFAARSDKQSQDGPPGSLYKPPFKHCEVVPIDIPGNLYDIKRRVLGTNGSAVVQISNEVGGTGRAVRIRIRGQGSGFLEGPLMQELAQPLHFNVSAETAEKLQQAVERVQRLVEAARTGNGAPQ